MLDFGKCSLKKIFPKKVKFPVVIFLLVLAVIQCFLNLRRENTALSFKTIALTTDDIQQINTRRSYYSDRLLGKIFENKLVFFLDKYKENLFQSLDVNYYFFANHPRERAGVSEKEIFNWYWLPTFLIGLYWSIRNSFLVHNLIFIWIVSSLSVFDRTDGFILFLIPLLLFNIFLGLKKIFFE